MSLSSKSREIIRIEDSQRVTKLGRECRDDVERFRQTMQRGGAMEKAVDARHVRFLSEALDGLTESYLDAYAREGQCPTMYEIDAITDEMSSRVRSYWQARVELEPRSVGIGFRESLEQIIPVQRQKLILAMKRLERERELATPQHQEPSSTQSMDKKQLDPEQRQLLISLEEASHRGAERRPTFHYTQPPPDGPPRVTHPGLRGELIVAIGDIERLQQLGLLVHRRVIAGSGNFELTPEADRAYEELRSQTTTSAAAPRSSGVNSYVHEDRIVELRAVTSANYDLARLIRLCEELNSTWRELDHHATAMLVRSIMDHVPPIFGVATFAQIGSNYAGSRSFKESMSAFESSARKIADAHLHTQIRRTEVLPTSVQVNFSQQLDMLLSEIVRILK